MFTRLYDKVRETPMWLPTANGDLYAIDTPRKGPSRDRRSWLRRRTGKSAHGPRAPWCWSPERSRIRLDGLQV